MLKSQVTSHKSQVILLLSGLLILSGCASVKESTRGFLGISTKQIEEVRDKALVKVFNLDVQACYDKVKEILGVTNTYIYTENKSKQLIAIYVSQDDTTPVGIFYKEIDKGKTQLEISSPSTYAKELIAKRIFTMMGKTKEEMKEMQMIEKGKTDEQGQIGY